MGFDIGRFVENTSAMGTTYLRDARRQRAAMASNPAIKSCGYCGAPGQTIGTRCEYCQVAVSQ